MGLKVRHQGFADASHSRACPLPLASWFCRRPGYT